MPKRTVFSDEGHNELDCFINTEGKLYLSIDNAETKGDPLQGGYITLDKADTKELIKILQDLESDMEE